MDHLFQAFQVRHIALTIGVLKEELGDKHATVVEEFVDMLKVNTPRFDEIRFRKQCHEVIKPGQDLTAIHVPPIETVKSPFNA